MLEKPDFPDEQLIAHLQMHYGLHLVQVDFLPLGGDLSSAVFRGVAHDDLPYFLKLRRGDFDSTSVELPRFLSEQGIAPIISPLPSQSGKLWVDLNGFNLMVYPFVEGTEGYEIELNERQWADFGAALKQIHTTAVPETISHNIREEDFSEDWRNGCRNIFKRLDRETFDDPVIEEMTALLQSRREMVLHAVERAKQLAEAMISRSFDFVLCHNDIHPGNLLLDAKGKLYIVDWDYPILAPKERDLMFIGGGQGFKPYIAEQEEMLFYRGYGPAQVDPVALAYYRYERGITDITVESERILSPTVGTKDRVQALEYLQYYFLPGCTLEMALKVDEQR